MKIEMWKITFTPMRLVNLIEFMTWIIVASIKSTFAKPKNFMIYIYRFIVFDVIKDYDVKQKNFQTINIL